MHSRGLFGRGIKPPPLTKSPCSCVDADSASSPLRTHLIGCRRNGSLPLPLSRQPAIAGRPAPLAPLRWANPPSLRSTTPDKKARAFASANAPLLFFGSCARRRYPPAHPRLIARVPCFARLGGAGLRRCHGGHRLAYGGGLAVCISYLSARRLFRSALPPPSLLLIWAAWEPPFLSEYLQNGSKVKGKPQGCYSHP